MYGHVITKFSGMGRFTKRWGSTHARAWSSAIIELKTFTLRHVLFKSVIYTYGVRFFKANKGKNVRQCPQYIPLCDLVVW